jgi:hypothetical protein
LIITIPVDERPFIGARYAAGLDFADVDGVCTRHDALIDGAVEPGQGIFEDWGAGNGRCPFIYPTTRCTRPTTPDANCTLIPCGCMADLVRILCTTPLVSLPVRWSCFCTTSTSLPMWLLCCGQSPDRAAYAGLPLSPEGLLRRPARVRTQRLLGCRLVCLGHLANKRQSMIVSCS